MAEVIDSYSETNQDDYSDVKQGGRTYCGQSFAVGASNYKLPSCKFYVQKVGTPVGNCYAEVYAHTGTYGTNGVPTGSALATSDAVVASTLSATFALQEFTFSGANQITLSANTNYVVVFKFDGSEAPNYVQYGLDSSSPSHGGLWVFSTDGSSWTAVNSSDSCFYVYGDVVVSTSVNLSTGLLLKGV